MTCICAIVKDGAIFMGADSAYSGGDSISIRPDSKIFINHGFLVGCAGSARAANLIRYKFEPPQPTQDEMFNYMVTGFAEGVRECLRSAGNTYKNDDFEYIGSRFLIGFYGRLFFLDGDYNVQEVSTGFEAIGSGADLAMGALYATPKMSPRKRIITALEASASFNTSVRAPWQIVRTKW